MDVLVTGGAGYIGSHAALRLLADGHRVCVIDDLSTGNRFAVDVLAAEGGNAFSFVEGDLRDASALREALPGVECVMHFAGKTNVGESVADPEGYWSCNVEGTRTLLETMSDVGVQKMVFSSSCAVYGQPPEDSIPIVESCPTMPLSPYGETKLAIEQMLADRSAAGDGFGCVALRYFNVAGADAQGRLGEVHDPETHLVPICLQCAAGLRSTMTILGDDYDTPDGTCLRDYVHVEDLIDAHVLAINAIESDRWQAFNVGTGRAYSVLEVLAACNAVTGSEISSAIGGRRAGDPPILQADATLIANALGWRAMRSDLESMVSSAWNWMQRAPGATQRS